MASDSSASSGSAILTLLHLADLLSDVSRSTYRTAPEEVRSQVTVNPNDSASQVTVTQGASAFTQRVPGTDNTTLASARFPKVPQGLQKDPEQVETRKQLLERRRKECKAEEVDVALAPVMKLNVPYVFYPEQFLRFRKLFPRISVDSGLHYTHHDHPVAHTSTMVGIRKIQSMLQQGEKALDINGNPNGNEQYNRFQLSRIRRKRIPAEPTRIDTLVEQRTAMDAVRKVTKWGPEFNEDGDTRWKLGGINDISGDYYKTFIGIHTLYYYSMHDVSALLNRVCGSKFLALVNYSPEQSGTLYGELNYSKSDGITTQTSPNGESYKHPDIDAWFQQNSYKSTNTRDFEGYNHGISWTSTCIGGPLYIITITACDRDFAEYNEYKPPVAPTLKVQGERSFFGLVKIGGADVRLRITNKELASELRHFMTLRDRANPQTFADLCVKARRCTAPDLVEGSRQFHVNDGELQDHIVYAYLVDAPGELEVMEGVKLLRGSLLEELSVALKLQGPDKKTPYLECVPILRDILGRSVPAKSLHGRTGPKRAGLFHTEPNSAGLLPTKRT